MAKKGSKDGEVVTFVLILFVFFGGSMTVNRIHYGDNVACRHKKWYKAQFPGADMPRCSIKKEKK